jgi:HD-GYP domain-containing protein (c-di-GMP phosphodiesterase class II)
MVRGTLLLLHDNKKVYDMAKSAVSKLSNKGKEFKLLTAFSAQEAKTILEKNNNDICAIIIGIGSSEANLRLKLVDYIREDLKNSTTSITLHCSSEKMKKELKIEERDIMAYVETAELTEEKLYYIIISAERYYKNASSLKHDNNMLRTVVSIMGDSNKCKGTEEVILINFKEMTQLFEKKLNIPVSLVVFIENKFFKSTPDFEKFKKYSAEKFIETLLPDHSIELNKNYFSWLNNRSFIATFGHRTYPLTYVEFGKPISKNIKNLIYLYFKELLTKVENVTLRRELDNSLVHIIFTLGEVIESRSEETGEHVERVSDYTEIICKGLGMGKEDSYEYKITSVLHDIGKIGVPDNILNKPGKLTTEEFETMKEHSSIGHDILSKSNDKLLKLASEIALYHHENWDGSGYPNGAKGTEIPIYGRIVTLADYYDALSSDRIYRKAWEEKRILDSIKELRGKKFDPKVVDTFFNNYDKIIRIRMNILHKKIGSPIPHIKKGKKIK